MSFLSPTICTRWRFVIPAAFLVTCLTLTGCVTYPPSTTAYSLIESYLFEGKQEALQANDSAGDSADDPIAENTQNSAFIPTDAPLEIGRHGL